MRIQGQGRRPGNDLQRLARHHFALLERFRRALGDAQAAPRLVLAVSGGADSLALLELAALARDLRNDVVVYVDHGLRPEAVAEAECVRRAAERHDASYRSITLEATSPDEASLRAARYAALRDVLEETGAAFLLTGHTRDDQIETIFHRLVRGAGRNGLAGMRTRRGSLLRPLLDIRRDELRAFLRERAIDWCEDASNADDRYLRNRLRNKVIPSVERELGSGCLDHLPDMARVWAEEEAYLEREAQRYGALAEHGGASDRRLDVGLLNTAPAALRGRIVRRWLARRSGRDAGSFSRAELERVLELSEGSGAPRTLALAGVDVTLAHGELVASLTRLASDPPNAVAALGGETRKRHEPSG